MKFRPQASGVNFEEISHITDGQILVLCVGQDPFLKLLTITYQRNHNRLNEVLCGCSLGQWSGKHVSWRI